MCLKSAIRLDGRAVLPTITKIEINFAIPIELTDKEIRALDKIAGHICDRSCPDGWAFWPSDHGQLPIFSQADLAFLGKPPDPTAKPYGEPDWDDTVYQIECAARELSDDEIAAKQERAMQAEVLRSRWDTKLADWFFRRGLKRTAWWVADASFAVHRWMR